MRFLSSMFKKTQRYRHFARLDNQGICIAFKSCRAAPANGDWVEVERVNLCLLGKPLPGNAPDSSHAQ